MSTERETDLNKYFEAALAAADCGRDILLHYFGRVQQVGHKAGAGLVSEADRESEAAIRKLLHQRCPEIGFLGEETGASGSSVRGQWQVDPLDGTHNYVNRFPFYCVSIGLELDGGLAVAVIDAPSLGDRYTAIQGQGAFLNNTRLVMRPSKSLNEALVTTGFPFGDTAKGVERDLNMLKDVILESLGVRRVGSAALDLCLVANGIFGGFWERGLNPWDTAAGTLVVREAGGRVTDFSGKEFDVRDKSILAGSPKVHAELLKIMSKN